MPVLEVIIFAQGLHALHNRTRVGLQIEVQQRIASQLFLSERNGFVKCL